MRERCRVAGRRRRDRRATGRGAVEGRREPAGSAAEAGPGATKRTKPPIATAAASAERTAAQQHRATLTGPGGRPGSTTVDGCRRPSPSGSASGRGHRRARRRASSAAGKRLYLVGGSVRDALVMGGHGESRLRRATRSSTSTSPPTPAPTRSSGSSRGWADAVWTQGHGSARSAAPATAAATRSPPTGPRSTGPTRASPRSPSATTSTTTCPGATSPSTRWPCGCPSSSSSTRSTGWPTWPPGPADPARTRGLLRRRPVADAPGGPVHRRLRPGARTRARRGGPDAGTTASRSSRPSGSATSSTG